MRVNNPPSIEIMGNTSNNLIIPQDLIICALRINKLNINESSNELDKTK